MTFNPLHEKGIPLEKQLRNWSELNVEPYRKEDVHPYSRMRDILMNGIGCGASRRSSRRPSTGSFPAMNRQSR